MSKLKHFVSGETQRMFNHNAIDVGPTSQRKQITLRPDAVVLLKIDTLSDMLDMSRQQLVDHILEQGVDDAIDAYCEAHGPDHEQDAHDSFHKAAMARWNDKHEGGES